ncbi:MAG: hypothetical protein ACJAV2_001443, partial [Myxococcota bacterium]
WHHVERGLGLSARNPDSDGDGIDDHWDLLGSESVLQNNGDTGSGWFDLSSSSETVAPPTR